MDFFAEVLIGGLLSGVMYSLVAIGFVLIYKASGVFNFAQGAMVLFGALTYVCLLEKGLPFWAGWETFERVNPENPANGYGFHPLRIWGSNVLFEADGVSVTRESVTSRIYFQSPLHRDPESGKFISPHHYDEQGTPWADAEETRQLGGIMWNKDNLNSCLTVDGEGMLTFIWNGESYQLLTTKKD